MKQIPELTVANLKQLKLPALCEDDKWLAMMGPLMDEELRILMTRQAELLHDQRQSVNHIIELKRQKKETLSQLLGLTAQLQRNDEAAAGHAERLKAILERINEEMDHLQFRVEIAPSEVQKLNLELLEETVARGYGQLLEDRKKINALNKKTEELRRMLMAMNEEKFMLEDNAAAMGHFLHALLGKELSDQMDGHYHLNEEVSS